MHFMYSRYSSIFRSDVANLTFVHNVVKKCILFHKYTILKLSKIRYKMKVTFVMTRTRNKILISKYFFLKIFFTCLEKKQIQTIDGIELSRGKPPWILQADPLLVIWPDNIHDGQWTPTVMNVYESSRDRYSCLLFPRISETCLGT